MLSAWTLACCLALFQAAPVAPQDPAALQPEAHARHVESVAVHPPCPKPGAEFGESVALLDLDADGARDVAVGAPGEGIVYVFHGLAGSARLEEPLHFTGVRLFSAQGAVLCPTPSADDGFGKDVWGAQLDADAQHELVVGAPNASVDGVVGAGAAYVIGLGEGPAPTRFVAPTQEAGRFGSSVAAADFDGDGFVDLAVGARHAQVAGASAGRVYVWFGPVDPADAPLVLDNPSPVPAGNFAQHMSVGDANADGLADLVVNALGNTHAGVPRAGQVFVFEGPLFGAPVKLIADPSPDPNDLPGPRYGMGIDARDALVSVGANRKDHSGLHDPGRGYTQSGPEFTDVVTHDHPDPGPSDYFAFRALLADVLGDESLDVSFIVLAPPRQILTWDGDALDGPPTRVIPARGGSQDHFGNGFDRGQLLPGGKEELLLGDPSYDRPGEGADDDSGRLVIYLSV